MVVDVEVKKLRTVGDERREAGFIATPPISRCSNQRRRICLFIANVAEWQGVLLCSHEQIVVPISLVATSHMESSTLNVKTDLPSSQGPVGKNIFRPAESLLRSY